MSEASNKSFIVEPHLFPAHCGTDCIAGVVIVECQITGTFLYAESKYAQMLPIICI